MPQIGRVLVRSLLDRTLLVLRRAVCVALPAGVLIWLLANAGGGAALTALTGFFDPIGRFFGLDGVILVAFLLALPANELIMPLMLMCYANLSSLTDLSSLDAFRALLTANGWTALTAAAVCLGAVPFALRDHAADHPPRDRQRTARRRSCPSRCPPPSGCASACSCAPSGCCCKTGQIFFSFIRNLYSERKCGPKAITSGGRRLAWPQKTPAVSQGKSGAATCA